MMETPKVVKCPLSRAVNRSEFMFAVRSITHAYAPLFLRFSRLKFSMTFSGSRTKYQAFSTSLFTEAWSSSFST